MIDLLLIPVAVVYLFVTGLLFCYGINFFYLTFTAIRKKHLPLEPPSITDWPRVTVQIPIYNEMYVAERIIRAASNFDYPSELLEIQVLDDSTDETVNIVRSCVEELRSVGVEIAHLHRANRHGYKAGALAEGLNVAFGEFLAIFDADFIPPADFLRRTIPYFKDSDIAFVQTRWDHVNRGYSILTLLQSIAIDAHFVIEQFARSRAGYWFNFNGTAGVWRRTAIEDAGGWKAETLTEDLDLSYRALFRGWRAVYLREVAVPAELPVSFTAYRRQQFRWACGSLECALKFVPEIWREPIGLPRKIQATFHLTGYCVHLLLAGLALLYPLVLVLSIQYPNLVSLFHLAILFTLTAFAPTTFFLASQRYLGHNVIRRLPAVLFLTALGAGMMVNTLRAARKAVSGKPKAFERTPKFGISESRQKWTNQRYQLAFDPTVIIELIFALINAVTMVIAISMGNWFIAVFAGIFCIGLTFAFAMTIKQGISVKYQQLRIKRNLVDKLS